MPVHALRTSLLLLTVAAVALTLVASEPVVAEDPTYGSQEAPVYFVISFDPVFSDAWPKGSETIVVNIGSLVGGQDVGDTRYVTNEALTGITLPDGRKDPRFEDLSDNAATVFGSFYALDEQGFHTAVPAPGEVSPELQEAVFLASNGGAIDALVAKKEFPTVNMITDTVVDHLPPGSSVTREDVFHHLFGSAIQLSLTTAGVAEGEGEIFPYEPYSASLYVFKLGFDANATVSQDVRLVIPVSFQSPINVSNKTGNLPVVIGDTEVYRAVDVVGASLTIGGVYADSYQLNGNGEMVAKFNVAALVDAGVLDLATTRLTLLGELKDGTPFTATGAVQVQ